VAKKKQGKDKMQSYLLTKENMENTQASVSERVNSLFFFLWGYFIMNKLIVSLNKKRKKDVPSQNTTLNLSS